MIFINDSEKIDLIKPTAVVIGKFDGVHIGHQALFNKTIEQKRKNDLFATAFTFDRNLSKNKVLTTSDERKQLAAQYGMDVLIEYPFAEIMSFSPEEFVKNILLDRLKAKVIIAGADCGFGKNRSGNAALLKQLGVQYGFDVEILDKIEINGIPVSSTYIRNLIEKGNIDEARCALGDAFLIRGLVVKGNQLGRTWNFPTINMLPAEWKMMPPNGVYASKVNIGGEWYHGVTNIGKKPTIDSNNEMISVETYIFNYSGDLYGKYLDLKLFRFIRPEEKFDSFDDLKNQIEKDSKVAKECLEMIDSTDEL